MSGGWLTFSECQNKPREGSSLAQDHTESRSQDVVLWGAEVNVGAVEKGLPGGGDRALVDTLRQLGGGAEVQAAPVETGTQDLADHKRAKGSQLWPW